MGFRIKLSLAASVALVNGGLLKTAPAAVIYNEVAATGLTVPGSTSLTYATAGAPNADTTETTNQIGGETFLTFSTPSINQAGDAAFTSNDSGATLVQTAQTSTAAANTFGLFEQQNGTLIQIAHEGTYAADRLGNVATATDSTGTFGTFSAVNTLTGLFIGNNDVLTDYARVKAYKTSGGSDDSVTPTTMSTALAGIYSTKSGNLALTYRQNDSLNSVAINNLYANSDANALATNPSGTIAALADTGSPSFTNASIVSDSGGTLHFVAQNGAATPITGTTFNGAAGFSNSYVPVINGTGKTAFRAGLLGTAITSTNNVAIFSEGGGTLHLVAQGYGQAPSTPAGDAYSSTGFGNPDLNNAGQTVFVSTLVNNAALGAGDIVSSTNNSTGVTANNGGLFTENATSGASLVARKGNQAYGLATGTVYSSFNNPVISDSGRIDVEVSLSNLANTPTLTAGTTSAFYSFDPNGAVTLIEQNGTIAPGTSLYFNNLAINNYAANRLGEIAFESALSSTVGGSSTATGLFAQDPTGTLQLVLVTGQSFTIAPGDISTVTSFTSLSNSGGEDGKVLSWNDNETLAVDLTFANGQQGIYTIAVSAVPEPTSLASLAIACGLVLRRSRRTSHSI